MNIQYSTWKPPEEVDIFITRGPKAINCVKRLGQKHIHIFDGSYRGMFLQKDMANFYDESSDISGFIQGAMRQYLRTTVQSSLNMVDHIVVNSEWTADVIRSLFNRNPDDVIYPPVPVETYDTKPTGSSQYYLYLGGVDPAHRIHEVFNAFNGTDYNLKVAGDGSSLKSLKKRASENVEFCGYVAGREKRELLSNSKALVNPAPHSFGRVIVESFASGRPVISINEGHSTHLITERKNGLLYDRGVENLSKAVQEYEKKGVTNTPPEISSSLQNYRIDDISSKWHKAINDVY